MDLAVNKMKFVAIVSCDSDYAALEKSLSMFMSKGIKSLFLFGGNAPKRYEIPPNISERAEELEKNDKGAFFYNADMPETLAEIDTYLHKIGADVWFFLNAGDTLPEFYPYYLESFFSHNHVKCGVVFTPVITDGVFSNLIEDDSRLPEEFLHLPKSGILSYKENFPKTLDGAAVWAESAFAAELNIAQGADAFAKLIDKTAQIKDAFGRLNKIYISRNTNVLPSDSEDDDAVNNSKHLVSCVIPVCNAEKYLKEAIESVISQSIGFEENIQLILINDGSTDGSGEICKSYFEKYPKNIVYAEQSNKGVSAARNRGIKATKGELLAFLDADDRLTENYLEVAAKYLEDNETVDFVAFPLEVFGDVRQNESHPLDWKFMQNVVIDTEKLPEYVQFHAASTVIRREAIGNLRFDVSLRYGEDAEFLHRLLMKNPMYGISIDACLEYRKHGESAIKNQFSSEGWYDKLELLPQKLIEASKKAHKKIMPYTQECIMYDLQWYAFKEKHKNVPPNVDWAELKEHLLYALKNVGDDVIKSAKYLSHWQKAYLLILKYGIPNCVYGENGLYLKYWRGLSEDISLTLRLANIEEYGNVIRIAGHSQFVYPEKYNVFAMSGGNKINARKLMRDNVYYLGECVHQECFFDFELVYDKADELTFYAEITGVGVFPVLLVYDMQSKMRNRTGAFVLCGNVLIMRSDKPNALKIVDLSFDTLKSAVEYNLNKVRRNENDKNSDNDSDDVLVKDYLRNYRVMSKRRIWLFMDRINKADDNAEHLFRYAVQQNDGVEKFFVIDEDCADFERMKQYGAVIAFGSDEHKMLMLFAEKYIASNFDNQYRYPFYDENQSELLKSLCRAEYVFLQHGVTKDDMSSILNRWQRNIKLFVTAGKPEYEAILNGDYGYDESVVKLTGFPRFDGLSGVENSEKSGTIVFAPTWRQTLAAGANREGYNPKFKETEYFRRINGVLNDETLIGGLENLGFTLAFRPHPVLYAQIDDFEIDTRVKVIENDESYQETIKRSDMLITDYSSVTFDFAYLNKPTVYYQFDDGNWHGGYFDYKTMGFGEIAETLGELTEIVLDYAENGCEMPGKYLERAADFFPYRDGESCKCVYEVLTV